MMDFAELLSQAEAPDIHIGELISIDYAMQIERVRFELEPYRVELKRMEAEVQALEVRDEQTAMAAIEYGSQAQSVIRKIKTTTEAAILKPNDYVRQVRNLAKVFVESLETIKQVAARKHDTFIAAERKRKDELEAKARKEAQELQDRLNREAQEKAEAEAKKNGVPVEEVKVEEIKIFEPVVEPVKTTIRAESGAGTAFQKAGKWTYRVIDISKVPVEYLEVYPPAVNGAIKAGIRQINGLEIYQEEAKTTFRSR